MRVLHINSVINTGSTGRIVEEIGRVLIKHGHDSYVAYGRTIGSLSSDSYLYKIGNKCSVYWHGFKTLFFDRHGFASAKATQKLIDEIDRINPHVIALYNLHGYYIHIEILFAYLVKKNIPVVWTLFDCWAFTGHCTYFDNINCEKWQTKCNNCPKYNKYPISLIDNSELNFESKKTIFNSLKKLELITHSTWLSQLVSKSYLKQYKTHVIPSAVNTDLFKPVSTGIKETFGLNNQKVILGCANTWSDRKGFKDFILLSELCDSDFIIVLIGVSKKQMRTFPNNIIGITKTESVHELAAWYSAASVFVNPTYMDNFPTTNIEALACGTPVVTYNTGGSPESIDEETGIVIKTGDVQGIFLAIRDLCSRNQEELSKICRERALKLYERESRFLDYLRVFDNTIKN